MNLEGSSGTEFVLGSSVIFNYIIHPICSEGNCCSFQIDHWRKSRVCVFMLTLTVKDLLPGSSSRYVSSLILERTILGESK